jgi:hypothetical protein
MPGCKSSTNAAKILFAGAAELDSSTRVSEIKPIRGKKQPLTSAGLHALRDEYSRTAE